MATCLVPALLVLAVRAWVVDPLIVSSDSMEPTIPAGSIVLLHKRALEPDHLRAGDVVAFTSPEDGRIVIKRVIAHGGEEVAIRDGEIFVDDVAIAEPLIDRSRIDATYFGPVGVPYGEIFVLGDNRGASIDSRDYGAVPMTSVRGVLLDW